jgi:hypothetical protein
VPFLFLLAENIESSMNIWKKLKAWNQRCRTCELDGISGKVLDRFPDQFSELKVVEQLKFGHLYQCEKCKQFWFLHEHKQMMDRIRPEYMPLVHYWNQNKLNVKESTLGILSSIGGVPDYYKGYISIPCSIQNTAGERNDKALVLVSKQPPDRWTELQKVHWASEIDTVSLSSFALPIDVRRASAEKREEAMGFAPVGVIDKKGIEYTLECKSQFFDHNSIKGEEIRLSGRQKKWKKVVYQGPVQAVYFVDWYDKCDEQLIPNG